jgi:IBR domain, a half RING-finger domain/Ring finger domain
LDAGWSSPTGWDEEEDEYVDDEDDVGHIMTSFLDGAAAATSPVKEQVCLYNIDPVDCPICLSKADSGTAVTLPSCGHCFCIECFQTYIQVKIEEGEADGIHCPQRACKHLVDRTVFADLLTDEEQAKLQKFCLNAFVLKNHEYHHCPTPDCANVVYWKEGTTPPIVDCFQCKKVSCLLCCATPYHTGLSCDEHNTAVLYRRKEAEDRLEQMISARAASRLFHTATMHTGGNSSWFESVDRSRADEEARYEFDLPAIASAPATAAAGVDATKDALPPNIRRCRRCGNGVELGSGCFKLKCRCGYRFCFHCGSENAQCTCTPEHHGFVDNVTCGGDFTGLTNAKSYT